MQPRLPARLFTAFAALLLFASCSKTNKQGKMIPKDAGYVVHINSRSLSEKVNMQELKQTDWYRSAMAEMRSESTVPDFLVKLEEYNQPSGIDTLADYIFFGENKMELGMKFVVEGSIKDSKVFEGFLKTIYPAGNISKEGDISVMPVKDRAVITWNNERFVAGIQSPSYSDIYTMDRDRGKMNANDSTGTDNTAANIPELTAYCKKMYALKDDDNLSKDKKFTELMNTEGDLHFWVNSEKLLGGSLPMGVLSMIKMDKFLEGNVSTLTVNFDKGRVSIKSKGYMGKELSDLFDKYSGGSINTDMLKSIPSKDVAGVFAFHFKPEGLRELVKLSGMDGIADLLLIRQGFTIDDFVKANKGDIMISVSDLHMKMDTMTTLSLSGDKQIYPRENPDARVLFSVAINDKDAFNKLIRAGKEQVGGQKNTYYNSNGNYFAIGNDAEMVNKYLEGGKTELPFLNKISGNAIGGYADIQKILKAFESEATKDSLGKRMFDESVKIWDNVSLTGGDYSGGSYNQLFEINLVDKNTNSLKQLISYSVTMSELAKEKMKQHEAENKLAEAKMMEEVKKIRPVPPRVKPKRK